MDRKDDFLHAVNLALAEAHISDSAISYIRNKVILELGKYDLTDRSTALEVVDNNSERLLMLFLGTLRTEGKSKRTLECYNHFLRRFWQEIGKPLVEVNTFDVRFWLAHKQNEISARSCENYRSYLSSFYSWTENEGFIDKSPLVKVKPVAFDQEVRKAFSNVELDQLRSGCKTLRQRAILEMLLTCGARVSELALMNIADVDFGSNEVHILHGKGGKQRTVYINDVCRMHLEAYLKSRTDDKPCLFLNKRGKQITRANIEMELHNIGSFSKVEDVHPHRCRRTFATGLYQRGMDIVSIQTLMGHSDINTTMRYIAIADNRVRYEYQRLS